MSDDLEKRQELTGWLRDRGHTPEEIAKILAKVDQYDAKTVRESIFDETWKAIRVGMLALISPVMTSTDGRCVARIR